MSQFKVKVYQVVSSISAGKVMANAQVVYAIGCPKAADVVGNTLHENSNPEFVPCHRIVFAKGMVSVNYNFGGAKAQKERLEKEGISFKDDLTVKNLAEHLFLNNLFYGGGNYEQHRYTP